MYSNFFTHINYLYYVKFKERHLCLIAYNMLGNVVVVHFWYIIIKFTQCQHLAPIAIKMLLYVTPTLLCVHLAPIAICYSSLRVPGTYSYM